MEPNDLKVTQICGTRASRCLIDLAAYEIIQVAGRAGLHRL